MFLFILWLQMLTFYKSLQLCRWKNWSFHIQKWQTYHCLHLRLNIQYWWILTRVFVCCSECTFMCSLTCDFLENDLPHRLQGNGLGVLGLRVTLRFSFSGKWNILYIILSFLFVCFCFCFFFFLFSFFLFFVCLFVVVFFCLFFFVCLFFF